MKHTLFVAAFLIAAVFLAGVVSAAVPQLISYQGRLTNSVGVPLDTTLTLIFTICSDSLGTTILWSETHLEVAINDGLFQVLLGSVTPFSGSVFNGSKSWLGVRLQGEPAPTPLIPIVSVAYAYRALESDTALYAKSGAGTSKWTLSGSTIYTNSYWGISRGGAGNILHGDSAHTMTNFGTNSFTGTVSQSYGYSTIAGGSENAARAWNSTVGGGQQNAANANYSTVAGGQRNQISSMYGAIAGGFGDTVTALYGGALSGRRNVAGDEEGDTAAFVGGGSQNRSVGQFSTIAGGDNNEASTRSFVGGGSSNKASGYANVIGGGFSNTIPGANSVIGGGQQNHITGLFSVIPGGYLDTITSSYSYLFGIDSRLTRDSTFMVDMPHVRFGKENGGYEFPTSDGAAGQVLATNGAGKLSWSSTSAAGGWTNGGTVVRLSNANDSVGIGTSTPTAKLHVVGPSAQGEMGGALFGVCGSHTSTLNTGSLGTNVYGAYGRHNASGNYGFLGSATEGVYGYSSAGFAGYFDGKAYIGGRLGIGTSMPLNRLDVEGGAAIGVNFSSTYTAPTNGLIVEGRTGIGKSSPSVQLDLGDMMRVGGATWPGPGTGEGMEIAYDPASNTGYIQSFDRSASTWGKISINSSEVAIGPNNGFGSLRIEGNNTWTRPHLWLSSGPSNYSRIIQDSFGLAFRNYTRSSGALPAFSFRNSGDTTLCEIWDNGEFKIPGKAIVGGMSTTGTLHLFHDGANANIATDVGNIYIATNANVGVATTQPHDKFEVRGNIRLDGGSGNGTALRFADGGTQKWAFVYRPWASGKLTFTDDTGPNILMTLDPVNDRVGINQDNPAYPLDVSGACHASSFPTSSDERFKKDIRLLENVLEKIASVRGVSFDWNEAYDSLGRSTGHREIGVIAQDVEAQFPELVTRWGDKDYRAVDYGRLTAVLIEAVKELKQENESLKQRLDALEKR